MRGILLVSPRHNRNWVNDGWRMAVLSTPLGEPRRQKRTISPVGAQDSTQIATPGTAWNFYRSAGLAISLHHLTVAFMAMVLYTVLAWTRSIFVERSV